MELLTQSIGQIIGCSCCCLLFVLVLGAIAALALRSKKPKAETLEGQPEAPDRGSRATASLTKLESNPPEDPEAGEGQTVVITRPQSAPPPVPREIAPHRTIDPAASTYSPQPSPRAIPPPPPRAPATSPPPLVTARPPTPPPVPAKPAPPAAAAPPPPSPRAFVPGRTIVVEDPDDVPMPAPRKKE